MITLVPNSECAGFRPSEYFRTLIQFERDPLPPPRPASDIDAVSGDQQRSPPRGAGAARPSIFRLSPAGEGRGRGLFNVQRLEPYFPDPAELLSQIEPMETV